VTREGNRREGKASRLRAPLRLLSVASGLLHASSACLIGPDFSIAQNFDSISVDEMIAAVDRPNCSDEVGDAEVP
jgi:hypothetical protein